MDALTFHWWRRRFVGMVAMLALSLVLPMMLAAQQQDPGAGPDWGPTEAPGNDWQWCVTKTGINVIVEPRKSVGTEQDFIENGERTLTERRYGVDQSQRFVVRYYSLYPHFVGPPARVTHDPGSFYHNEDFRRLGQLVIVWAEPTSSDVLRYCFIQLVRRHDVTPDMGPPGAMWHGTGPTTMHFWVDALPASINAKRAEYDWQYSADENAPQKGKFMVDGPGILCAVAGIAPGNWQTTWDFYTWLLATVSQPAPAPPKRLLIGTFDWRFLRKLNCTATTTMADFVAVLPVIWRPFTPQMPVFKAIYAPILSDATWWPHDPDTGTTYMPHP